MTLIADADKEHCRRVTSKQQHCSKQCHEETASHYVLNRDAECRSNEARDTIGVDLTPLLLGKVQLGTIHNDQRETLIEELLCRDVSMERRTNITDLKKLLINNECPDKSADANDKKFFLPKFLTATD